MKKLNNILTCFWRGRLSKMKTLKKVLDHTRMFFSIPSLWASLLILVFAVCAILLSKSLHNNGKLFWSSVLSNIFAGLITGFVLYSLSGIKAVYCARLEQRYCWLKETHDIALNFINKYQKLRAAASKPSADDFFEEAYEAASRAKEVNGRIMQGMFDKTNWIDPPKCFLKHYNYDCMGVANKLNKLKESVDLIDLNQKSNRENIELFKPIFDAIHCLNKEIFRDLRNIEIKITSARKSMI